MNSVAISDLALVIPERILIGMALILILLARRIRGTRVAMAGTVLAAVVAGLFAGWNLTWEGTSGFGGMIVQDGYSQFFEVLIAAALARRAHDKLHRALLEAHSKLSADEARSSERADSLTRERAFFAKQLEEMKVQFESLANRVLDKTKKGLIDATSERVKPLTKELEKLLAETRHGGEARQGVRRPREGTGVPPVGDRPLPGDLDRPHHGAAREFEGARRLRGDVPQEHCGVRGHDGALRLP